MGKPRNVFPIVVALIGGASLVHLPTMTRLLRVNPFEYTQSSIGRGCGQWSRDTRTDLNSGIDICSFFNA